MAASVACSATRSRATSTGSCAGWPASRCAQAEPGPALGHVRRRPSATVPPAEGAHARAKTPWQRYPWHHGRRPARRDHPARGLAHPLRVRMLGLLREHGPATATTLAERLGPVDRRDQLSPAAAGGVRVRGRRPARDVGRERWWQAAQPHEPRRWTPVRPAEAEGYMRAVAAQYTDRVDRLLDELPPLPGEWLRRADAQRLAAAAHRRRGARAPRGRCSRCCPATGATTRWRRRRRRRRRATASRSSRWAARLPFVRPAQPDEQVEPRPRPGRLLTAEAVSAVGSRMSRARPALVRAGHHRRRRPRRASSRSPRCCRTCWPPRWVAR